VPIGSSSPSLGSNGALRFSALGKVDLSLSSRGTGRRERRKNSPCVGRRKVTTAHFLLLIARTRHVVAHFVAHHFEITYNILKL
jgi:hypothetical protein